MPHNSKCLTISNFFFCIPEAWTTTISGCDCVCSLPDHTIIAVISQCGMPQGQCGQYCDRCTHGTGKIAKCSLYGQDTGHGTDTLDPHHSSEFLKIICPVSSYELKKACPIESVKCL